MEVLPECEYIFKKGSKKGSKCGATIKNYSGSVYLCKKHKRIFESGTLKSDSINMDTCSSLTKASKELEDEPQEDQRVYIPQLMENEISTSDDVFWTPSEINY
tara:strand:- start:416 stop:724 length:309 start_codon:yes stop_codon:yes gene_type:complete